LRCSDACGSYHFDAVCLKAIPSTACSLVSCGEFVRLARLLPEQRNYFDVLMATTQTQAHSPTWTQAIADNIQDFPLTRKMGKYEDKRPVGDR